MRLRLTVKRHNLPETLVVWNVDVETSSIAQLLEQVNDAIPIESGDWGFEDYAVELKGTSGAGDYECLHYKVVKDVFREDDEVIIRPLLTHDRKVRRISGRVQISSDGKHLLDGLPWGRAPLKRRIGDRPPIAIPALKRQRITYDEATIDDDDDDDDDFQALKQKEEENENSDIEESRNNERQIVLHADFDDSDSEDDEDFEPGEEGEAEESEPEEEEEDESSNDEEVNDEVKGEEANAAESPCEEEQSEDASEPSLRGVPNSRRAQIRKLHSAFPTSKIAVCKYILDGTNGDFGEAYEAMTIGFKPVLYKVALTETSEERLELSKTRSKKQKAVVEVPDKQEGNMQVEVDDSVDPWFEHYDRNGLPPGSIASGKALSVMAEVINSSPSRPRPTSRGSDTGGKSTKFSEDGVFPKGLISTPFVDRESQIGDVAEDDASSSEDTSSDDNSSSEDNSEAVQVSDETSTSGSDSDDSNSDSANDSDDAPEETSSKPKPTISITPQQTSKSATQKFSNYQAAIKPGTGKMSTKRRNERRRNANLLERYKKKGILPPGTTLTDWSLLKEGISMDTSPDDALAALAAIRSAVAERGVVEDVEMAETEEQLDAKEELTGQALAKADEFEQRRAALLSSIQSDGIDIDDISLNAPETSLVQEEPQVSHTRSAVATPSKTPAKSSLKATEGLVASITPSNRASRSPFKAAEQFSEHSKQVSTSSAKSLVRPEVASTSSRASKSPSKPFVAMAAAAIPSRASKSPFKSRRTAIAPNPSGADPTSPSISPPNTTVEETSPAASHVSVIVDEQPASAASSTALEVHESIFLKSGSGEQIQQNSKTLQNLTTAEDTTSGQSKTPASSAASVTNSATPTRRPRLNLGVANRLLFGDLGKKAPKTKKDEEKLRADFDKYIRPVHTLKPAEQPPEPVEEYPKEDPDAWKENINYRAVECCYEVELSEPPFPFEQRWDPQQQYGFSTQGNRGGKRKQDMRGEPQYCETQKSTKKQKKRKGKCNYTEEQEYLAITYDPNFQDDSLALSYDEPTQDTSILSDDFNSEINQQLMNDLRVNSSAVANHEPEDLPPLPKDTSSLPDLQEERVKPGMIIAFKLLTFGAETNWSPLFSEYKTATVIESLENGDICVQLASRDRESRQKGYDPATGKRVYGRFEMPLDSDEDDEEDDDKIYKPFKQLLNPKIIQDAPKTLIEEQEAKVDQSLQPKDVISTDQPVTLSREYEEEVEVQFSHVTETQLGSDPLKVPDQGMAQPEQDFQQPEEFLKPNDKSSRSDHDQHEGSSTPQKPSHQPEEMTDHPNVSQGSEAPSYEPDASSNHPTSQESNTPSHQAELSSNKQEELVHESEAPTHPEKLSCQLEETFIELEAPSQRLEELSKQLEESSHESEQLSSQPGKEYREVDESHPQRDFEVRGDKEEPLDQAKQQDADPLVEEHFEPEQYDILPGLDSNQSGEPGHYAPWNGIEDEDRQASKERAMAVANGVALDEMTGAACPMCTISLDGISTDLANRHVNGCIDGKFMSLPEALSTDSAMFTATVTKAAAVDDAAYTASISDEKRQEYSRLIKDAGFRSSIPSSVTKDIRPEGLQSPGDAAVFKNSLTDMTGIDQDPPYSPKFTGFGSSPSRSPRQPSRSPLKSPQRGPSPVPTTQSSWQTVNSSLPSRSLAKNQLIALNPTVAQSSWQIVDSRMPSSTPARMDLEAEVEDEEPAQGLGQKPVEENVEGLVREPTKEEGKHDEASWETLGEPPKPAKPSEKKLTSKVSQVSDPPKIRKAQAALEKMKKNRESSLLLLANKSRKSSAPPSVQPVSRESSVQSNHKLQSAKTQPKSREASFFPSIGSPKPSPALSTDSVQTHGASLAVHQEQAVAPEAHVVPFDEETAKMEEEFLYKERDKTPTIHYPKLSLGSYFTSQVSDHGRQPDVTFDDSVGFDAESPEAFNFNDDSYRPDEVVSDAEPELPPPKVICGDIQSTKFTSAFKAKPSGPKTFTGPKKVKEKPVISDEDFSDSDDLPSLEQLSQSQQADMKSENSASIPLSMAPTKADRVYQKATFALDEDVSEDKETTPQVSQQNPCRSLFKVPQSRASQSDGSSSRASVLRNSLPPPSQRLAASQPRVPASQLIDLTQGSSDLDPDEDKNNDGGNSADVPLKPFRRPQIMDEDDGWVKKRTNSPKQKSRRHTGGGSLKASSQALLNARQGRKNTKF